MNRALLLLVGLSWAFLGLTVGNILTEYKYRNYAQDTAISIVQQHNACVEANNCTIWEMRK